jgi:hypothetical protein
MSFWLIFIIIIIIKIYARYFYSFSIIKNKHFLFIQSKNFIINFQPVKIYLVFLALKIFTNNYKKIM